MRRLGIYVCSKVRNCAGVTPNQPPEHLGEMALIRETACSANRSHLQLRIAQVSFGSLDATLQNVLIGSRARALLELLTEIIRTQPGHVSEFSRAQVSGAVSLIKSRTRLTRSVGIVVVARTWPSVTAGDSP